MRKQIKNYEKKIKNLEEFMMGQMNNFMNIIYIY
jgi:hypothetical protein